MKNAFLTILLCLAVAQSHAGTVLLKNVSIVDKDHFGEQFDMLFDENGIVQIESVLNVNISGSVRSLGCSAKLGFVGAFAHLSPP
jgi:hypothetical protein